MSRRKQLRPKRIKTIPACPYCGNNAKLVPSSVIYGPYRDYGMFWFCADCDAYTGVHKNSTRYAPLGILANAELRQLRKQIHAKFDPLWKMKMRRDNLPKGPARAAGYAWLADMLGINVDDCHIGKLSVNQCMAALVMLDKLYE